MEYLLETVGGGKTTVEGLTPDVLLAGHTVTVKQGSEIVEQMTGEYQFAAASVTLIAWCPNLAATDSIARDSIFSADFTKGGSGYNHRTYTCKVAGRYFIAQSGGVMSGAVQGWNTFEVGQSFTLTCTGAGSHSNLACVLREE